MNLSDILTPEILMAGKFWTHSMTLVDGCTKVSPGCLNCWSEAVARRFGATGKPSVFDGRIIERPERCADILPRSIRRKPRVWTYWNDVFHEGVSEALHHKLFSAIEVSKDYHIICTKRPERAVDYFRIFPGHSAAANLIIMVTMEDQVRIEARHRHALTLFDMGHTVGALVEPMLGYVTFQHLENCFSWIICGPENGKGKRPFDGQWAMRLQAQAQAAGIPFYYKAGLLNGKRYIETP